MNAPTYDVTVTTGSSATTLRVPEDLPDGAPEDGPVVYMVGPVDATLGLCAGCGCRLQHPGPYDGRAGSIWLTPWMKWRDTNRCTVCVAYEGNADAQAELRHWLALNAPYEPDSRTDGGQ